jgi:hypothetical protein
MYHNNLKEIVHNVKSYKIYTESLILHVQTNYHQSMGEGGIRKVDGKKEFFL